MNNSDNTEVLESIFSGVRGLLNKRKTPWVGTMSELNDILLSRGGGQVLETWPKSPSSLRLALNKVVNRLRNAGVSIKFTRSKSRLVRLAYSSKK